MSVGVFKNGQYIKTAGLPKDIDIFTPATETTNGSTGLVVAPLAGDQDKFLKADGTWATVSDDSYEAGENVTFTEDSSTGKTAINAGLAVPYTFEVDDDGNLIAYFPDTATEEEMKKVVQIDSEGNLILTV